jgi:hypothetical protein
MYLQEEFTLPENIQNGGCSGGDRMPRVSTMAPTMAHDFQGKFINYVEGGWGLVKQ